MESLSPGDVVSTFFFFLDEDRDMSTPHLSIQKKTTSSKIHARFLLVVRCATISSSSSFFVFFLHWQKHLVSLRTIKSLAHRYGTVGGVTKRSYDSYSSQKTRERKAITVFRPWSSPVAAAIRRPVVTMMYPPQVAVARAAPEIYTEIGNERRVRCSRKVPDL